MERFEVVKKIGSGNFGVANLLLDKKTQELFAAKYIERGSKIDANVQREIINHRSLQHPNIIRFKEVFLTSTHLAILMEYAAGGELFQRICSAGRFSEDEVCWRSAEALLFFSVSKHQTQLPSVGLAPDILGSVYADASSELCRAWGQVWDHQSLVFFDPGARANFITPQLAEKMEIKTNEMGPTYTAFMAAPRHEARFFFQQLISGVSYCHDMQICHRDLKLENTLLDDSAVPRLKICDFGYSKSSLLHSQPKSTVGTPAYIAPEVLAKKEYDGKIADVWSCGVTLYVMLVGSYPFEDPQEPRNFRKSIGRILSVQYTIPDYVRISLECRNFLSQIFVANPEKRITIAEIKQHPWFLKNLPKEMQEEYNASNKQAEQAPASSQSVEDIMRIVEEARIPGTKDGKAFEDSLFYGDEMEFDPDVGSSGDFVCAV
ncbi:hypothetical protein L7F22_040429 [Adiantum nelumboides]|nr:hypothetical protein [Adiantum nelumboides]